VKSKLPGLVGVPEISAVVSLVAAMCSPAVPARHYAIEVRLVEARFGVDV